ncbi:MAG TPA: glycoside hydrolase family 36 protein [Capsulimonadaceae bacterium]
MNFLTNVLSATDGLTASTTLPWSFTYGGRHSSTFIDTWTYSRTAATVSAGRSTETHTYTDSETGLVVSVDVTLFDGYPAAEWVMRITNTGATNTPIIEKVLPLDLDVAVPAGNTVLHHSKGSTCGPDDFLPLEASLHSGAVVAIAPRGGRSSDGALPFFNLACPGGGIVGAIGWSGQWSLDIARDAANLVTLRAGQQTTRFTLYPGEEVRTPRMLLVGWRGNNHFDGHNAFRRLLIQHYIPRINGAVAQTPIAANTWFAFNTGNDVTEENQLATIPTFVASGIEYFWLDAGWFEGGWPAGAGSWVPKKDAFPRGLRPLSDAGHAAGMKFVLWFEPERVTPISIIAREHPEWVLARKNDAGGEYGALFSLGDPDARRWLTDYLLGCLVEWDVDVFRNDFNIEPLPFWQATDTEDRIGITEIRYIEGLYAMWDELRARKPGLTIDNCASGGRRIDLETIARSYPLWQSDTQCCGHDRPIQNQVQNAGLSLYVPQHTAGAWEFDHYNFRSVATSGYSVSSDLRQGAEIQQAAKLAADEVNALRPYYLGDYYPLLPVNTDPSAWCGWQYHRPDLRSGFVMLFRRDASPYPSAVVALCGLDSDATYTLTDADSGRTWSAAGADLAAGLLAEISSRSATLLIRYEESARSV